MPLDPSIILAEKPVPTPIEQMTQAANLRNALAQGQGMQLQNQQTQMAIDGQQALNKAIQQATTSDPNTGQVSIDHNQVSRSLMQAGFGNVALNYNTAWTGQQRDLQQMTKDQLANLKTKNDMYTQAAGALLAIPPGPQRDQEYQRMRNGLITNGVASPDQVPTATPDDNWLRVHQYMGMDTDKQITAQLQQRETDAKVPGELADSLLKQKKVSASALWQAARRGPGVYPQALAAQPENVRSFFPGPSEYTNPQQMPDIQRRIAAAAEDNPEKATQDTANLQATALQSQLKTVAPLMGKAAHQGQQAYAQQYAQLDPSLQRYFDAPDQYQTGKTEYTASMASLNPVERSTIQHQRTDEQQNAQRIGIEATRARAEASLAQSAQSDREVGMLGKPYQASLASGQDQMEKITEAQQMLKSGNAETQALAIPKVLTALVSGRSTGVRITQPELNAIGGARGITGDVTAWLQKLAAGKKLTGDQTAQLNGVLQDVGTRIQQKMSISSDTINQLQNAPDRASRIRADQTGRQRLNSMETSGAGPQEVRSQQEFDALPSGATYLENGHLFRKP